MHLVPALLLTLQTPAATAQEPAPPATAAEAPAAAAPKRALDMEAAVKWRSVSSTTFSKDGAWLLYRVSVTNDDDATRYHVVETRGDREHVLERVSSVRFTPDGTHLVYLLDPPKKEKDEDESEAEEESEAPQRRARGGRGRGEDDPGKTLVFVNLATGEESKIEGVRSYRLPEEASGVVGYEPVPRKEKKDEKKEPEGEEKPATEAPAKPEPAKSEPKKAEAEGEEKKDEEKPKTSRSDGTTVVLRRLSSGHEQKLEHVSSWRFTKDGATLVFTTSTKEMGGDGLHVRDLESGMTRTLLEGEGSYRSVTMDDEEKRIAFLSDVADFQAEEPEWGLYYAKLTNEEAHLVVGSGHTGLPDGWVVASGRGPSFSDSGERLFFGSQPAPEPKPEEVPDDEKVVVDIWAWTDEQIQPQQLRSASRDRNRSYEAVVHLENAGRVVQLADEVLRGVSLASGRDGRWAIATDDRDTRKQRSWETHNPVDVWRIDVMNGERTRLVEDGYGMSFSPTGERATWWDPIGLEYHVMEIETGKSWCLTEAIPTRLDNELHDTPQIPRSYGTTGWLEDDAAFLVNDSHDIWRVDPKDPSSPVCVTHGMGREHGLRFRRTSIDPDASGGGGFRGFRGFGGGSSDGIDPAEPMLLTAYDTASRASGFWRIAEAGGAPEKILMDDVSFGRLSPSKEGGLLHYTRQSFSEYPDVWITDTDFSFHRRISHGNPQQAEFKWGSGEVVNWHSTNGTKLEGLLYKPDDFDASKQYPMIVYFYERNSEGLHRYPSPVPGRSSVSYSYYVSNGYLIFVPDIPYRLGYPGESAEAAILPGISKLLDTGYVDPEAIGVQGHSWGGYQIAHLITRTDVFSAAVSGAPVSNMVSAYGGIRWASGLSRMFQYERTQSRIGGTLWDETLKYLENSPIFFADRVQTPVLILHNDEDGAVPWYQGIEFFVALRRLERPAWMLNYNGEGHGIGKFQNRRDYAIRMFQFFDHFLRGAPAPVWIERGVPATMKGRTLGLELVK